MRWWSMGSSARCKAREIEKAEKKRAKENEKLVDGSLAIPRRTRAYSIRD
jgi:hypothetical protein